MRDYGLPSPNYICLDIPLRVLVFYDKLSLFYPGSIL